MAKMANLASSADPTKAEDASEQAPQPIYKSSANVHAEDMEKMGMKPMAPGDHVEGMMHGVVTGSHEGGMMMHITHGAMKKAGKTSKAEKMYGRPADGGDGDGGLGE